VTSTPAPKKAPKKRSAANAELAMMPTVERKVSAPPKRRTYLRGKRSARANVGTVAARSPSAGAALSAPIEASSRPSERK